MAGVNSREENGPVNTQCIRNDNIVKHMPQIEYNISNTNVHRKSSVIMLPTLSSLGAPEVVIITTHLLSIERANWPKLHDMFKAHDAIAWQREFPVGFPVEVSALNSLFINIFHDVVARIESRCVIKAKHALLVC